MMRTTALASLVIAAVAATTAPASAKLFGVSSGINGFYEIDSATGAATLATTLDATASLSGLAQIGGTFYVSDLFGGGPATVRSIDTTTGVTTVVSDQAGSANWHGLAADRGAGVLYAIDMDVPSRPLKRLDPATGIVTTIGAGTGIEGRGMAYDNIAGVLYALGPSSSVQSVYTVDTTTGVSSLIGETGVNTFFAGLAYDEETGALYMTGDPDNGGSGSSNLYRIDTTTGAATLIGSTGVDRLDGLEWISGRSDEVPAPASIAGLGAALAGLAALRRRKA